MKNLSKLLSVLLILCLFATFAPVAFAEDTDQTVWATAPGEEENEVTVSVEGNVTVTSSDDNDEPAVIALATSGGTATVTVSGDVTNSDTSSYADSPAVISEAMASEAPASATVKVDGSVTATATDEDPEKIAVAVLAAGSDATATATIGKDVTATGIGAEVLALDGGTASLEVGGNLEGTGEFSAGAMILSAAEGTAELKVSGDVTGNTYGIAINPYTAGPFTGDAGTINVLVEGTVKGSEASIIVGNPNLKDAEVELIVWKAEKNDKGEIVGIPDYSEEKEYYEAENDTETLAEIKEYEETLKEVAKTIDDNILYIIKYDDPEGGKINLQGAIQKGDLYCAQKDTVVTLDVKVPNGYKLVAAFDGDIALTQDANGNYFLTVPYGGGVYVKVKLDKVAAAANDVYTGPAILGTRQFKDGTFLYLFADNTFTIIFPDGKTEKGTWEFEDGAIVFTNKSGDTFEPTKNDDGNYEYTYVRKDGKEFKFTLSKTFTGRTIKAAEKV